MKVTAWSPLRTWKAKYHEISIFRLIIWGIFSYYRVPPKSEWSRAIHQPAIKENKTETRKKDFTTLTPLL